jgi:DUF438 domain-containing protein
MDQKKKRVIREIIHDLHGGLTMEKARERITAEVGTITSTEITEIEQSLITEGVPAEEIKRFCNVHALIFEAALEKSVAEPDSPAHPVSLLKRENREIEKAAASLKAAASQPGGSAFIPALERLAGVAAHYSLKEQALFPFLEKHGFYGPSQVMWAKHDEVRGLLKKASAAGGTEAAAAAAALVTEVEGMIFKEENILFPAALEKLTPAEWIQVLKACQEIGFPYVREPEIDKSLTQLAGLEREAFEASGTGEVSLPTGRLSGAELAAIMNTLPVDVTFVDAQDTVRYFSESRDRIFVRARSVIGRKVQNCHPPASVHKVAAILEAFRSGTRDSADFWITLGDRFISIRYFALRGAFGEYLGCLEVSQDLTGPRALQGERRLMDDEGDAERR